MTAGKSHLAIYTISTHNKPALKLFPIFQDYFCSYKQHSHHGQHMVTQDSTCLERAIWKGEESPKSRFLPHVNILITPVG